MIDDAWRIEAALALKVGGPHCAYLVTTRFPSIALHFTHEAGEAVVLKELSKEDGLALLARLAPEVVKSEPEGARALVEAVGGLPLALTLMGKYLRTQQHGGIRAASVPRWSALPVSRPRHRSRCRPCTLAARQVRYDDAAAYLQRALSLARQVGDTWLLSAVLNKRGDLYLKQQRLDEAYAAFSESLAVSAEGSQEEVASALYGLARVAAGKGDREEAKRLGRKCPDILEPMGNRLKDDVREWLERQRN